MNGKKKQKQQTSEKMNENRYRKADWYFCNLKTHFLKTHESIQNDENNERSINTPDDNDNQKNDSDIGEFLVDVSDAEMYETVENLSGQNSNKMSQILHQQNLPTDIIDDHIVCSMNYGATSRIGLYTFPDAHKNASYMSVESAMNPPPKTVVQSPVVQRFFKQLAENNSSLRADRSKNESQ